MAFTDTAAAARLLDDAPARTRPSGEALDPVAADRSLHPWLIRGSLIALLVLTAALYLIGLGASGYANSFYAAAAQAGSQNWTAWFFGSLDAGNSITVDKPPASLWLMSLSVRIFGLSSWSILVPQALLGVATVGVLYATIRRSLQTVPGVTTARAHWAGLAAGLMLAITPVATLMFRFNNPDALLVFLLTLSVWMTVRAVEKASARWLVGAGIVVGFAFLTKMLQAFLVLPALMAAYLVAAPIPFGRRIRHLLYAFAAMVVSMGWYVAIVELVPASWRPYIGGSQSNSFLELVLGYNGLGRITGEQTGSVGGGGGQGGGWGETGITRLFDSVSGGMISWLLPAALILTVAALVALRHRPRTDVARAGLVAMAGTTVVTGLVFSFMAGIYHDYYTVALAPFIAGAVAIGAAVLWQRRGQLWVRIVLAATMAVTTAWSVQLLGRAEAPYSTLRWVVLPLGLVAVAGLLLAGRLPRMLASAALGLALTVSSIGPLVYSLQTAATPHTGSIVTAGPVSGGMGGRGGMGGPGGRDGMGGRGQQNGQNPNGQTQNGGGMGGPGGGQPPQAPNGQSQTGQSQTGQNQNGQTPNGQNQNGRTGGPGGDGGGMGGLLNGATVDAETAAALGADAASYTWMAATIGSQNAASYQLATGFAVMAIGGFNGSDPSPTLAQFQEYVAQGRIHWFIAGGVGQANGGSDTGSQISTWVSENFTTTTVGGVTVYDLTSAKN